MISLSRVLPWILLAPLAAALWRVEKAGDRQQAFIRGDSLIEGSHQVKVPVENDVWNGEQSESLYSHPRVERLVKSELTNCDPSCDKWWIGDGTCDKRCLNEECAWDNGDCNLSETPKIAYLHIRKTGGTSLHKYLSLLYASYGAQVCRVFSWQCDDCSCGYWDPNAKRNGFGTGMHSCNIFSRPQTDSEAKCDGCVDDILRTGCHYVELHHWDMTLARQLKERGYKIVTMLRHPVHSLESSYNYEAFARNGQSGRIPGYEADQSGFEKWMKDRQMVEGFDALRMLAGCWYEHDGNATVSKDCLVNPTYYKRDELERASSVSTKLSREELYLKAQLALEEMDFVGLTEDFQRSVELLHRTFFSSRGECEVCKQIREGTKMENVQTVGHKFSFKSVPALRDDLEESMEHDILLYEEAQVIFNNALKAYGITSKTITSTEEIISDNATSEEEVDGSRLSPDRSNQETLDMPEGWAWDQK
eukprot:CAMPEP_0185260394 /NCGR_PEP_ID=MMETSP1359-20130426/8990_1 /TAXON_ID=552665 /ORGANISM="Bigelowiella longifila, Strain CCMP242" /LENGTH=476 /DNA_ID=CAMNT_0027846629 /DNA_START=57 /DNA_END=1487 /DNA_ORIENTATION=+